MEKIFTKKLTKKGFTLAELLIVVAIIAVLVAIAAPLFTGALKNAQETADAANVRALRAAAVAEILLDKANGGTKGYGTDGPWVATAKLSGNGDFTELKITQGGTGPEGVSGETVTAIIHALTVTP